VRRPSVAGADRFTLRNELQLYNQQLVTTLFNGDEEIDGSVFDSISGQLDTSQFCTAAAQPGCIRDVVVSATSLSPDGRFRRDVRSMNVPPTGAFLLYPLPSDSVYDIVIRGTNMQTIVVRNVFVDPTAILKPFPTSLSSPAAPIVPVLDLTGVVLTQPTTQPLAPTGSRVFFGQTVAGSGGASLDVPYVIAAANADPMTGLV